MIFAAISFVERGGGVDALVDICGSCLLLGIVWVFFLFYLIDRNNFDFDGQQFEIEKAKSNGIYDLHNMCITKV